jgi:methyltransferase (TIGR00027 family)
MQDQTPSRTAMRVAMRRAAHQLFDHPPVLVDALAVRIIGDEARRRVEASRTARDSSYSRAARAYMAVRSRFAEDYLARAVERGVRQYVLLGAGLDTFAYRSPFADLHVFEVDHPATQAWKRRKLTAGRIDPPSTVTFVPVDFEREGLADRLEASGFRREAPAFFAWLGVTMYLTDAAIDATLSLIASTPRGGGLALDYLASVPWHHLRTQVGVWWLKRKVAAAGEPFTSSQPPRRMHGRLSALGFHSMVDLDSDAINARYFSGRPDRLAVRGSAGRLLSAEL